jgi:uncharacterized DUF497 family protein
MKNRLHINRLVWDEWNREHVANHQVLPEEAEEVAAATPTVRESYKQRYQLIGPTLSGRMVSVIVGPVPEQQDVYYVFSASPASRAERRIYDDFQKGGSEV